MKKFLMVGLMGLFAFSAMAAAWWNNKEKATEVLQKAITNKDAAKIVISSTLVDVLSLNASTTTYETLKTTAFTSAAKAKTQYSLNVTDDQIKKNAVQVIIHIIAYDSNYKKFMTNVANDSELKNYQNYYYVYLIEEYYSCFNTDTIRTNLISVVKGNNVKDAVRAYELYSSKIFEKLNDADAKADLKSMKRRVYPKIGKSDDWKNLAVKIELNLKSLE